VLAIPFHQPQVRSRVFSQWPSRAMPEQEEHRIGYILAGIGHLIPGPQFINKQIVAVM
jgi:hypothetical protein